MKAGRARNISMAAVLAAIVLVTAIVIAGLGRSAAAAPLLTLAVALLFSVGVLTIVRPELLVLVFIGCLPWASKLAYPSASFTVLALIRLILPVLFVGRALVYRERLMLPRFLAPLGIFLLLVLLSLMVSSDPSEGLVKTLRYVSFAAALFAAIQFLGERAWVFRAIRVLVISSSAASTYALVGFLSGALLRADGPLADPNDFAYLLATVVPLAVFLFIEDRAWRGLWGIALAVLLAGSLASLSRGAYVGLAGLVVWGMATRRVSAVALLGALTAMGTVLVVVLALFGSVISQRIEGRERVTGSSAAARTAFWGAAAQMSLDHPLVGVGPERFDAEREKYLKSSPIALGARENAQSRTRTPVSSVHDSYLEIAAEDGILAGLAFAYLLVAVWLSLREFRRDRASSVDDQGKRLAGALQGSLIVAVLSGAFVSGQLEAPFWLVSVLAGALTAGSALRVPSLAGRRWVNPEPFARALSDRTRLSAGSGGIRA